MDSKRTYVYNVVLRENGREKTASVVRLHWQEQTLNLQQYEQEKANYHRCAVE